MLIKQRAEEAEKRNLETSNKNLNELQGALLEIERLRGVDADSMTQLSDECDNIFRMEIGGRAQRGREGAAVYSGARGRAHRGIAEDAESKYRAGKQVRELA